MILKIKKKIVKSNSLLNISKALGLDYTRIELSNNKKLPSWFENVEILHGVLYFYGVP